MEPREAVVLATLFTSLCFGASVCFILAAVVEAISDALRHWRRNKIQNIYYGN